MFTSFDVQRRLQGNFNSFSSKFGMYQRQAAARDKISSIIDFEPESNFSSDPSIISLVLESHSFVFCFVFCLVFVFVFSTMPDILIIWIRLFNNILHSQFFW